MRRALLILSLLFTTSVTAECASCNNPTGSWTSHRTPTSPSPLPRLICNGYSEVMGEVLYLRPTTCDLDYVIADPREIPSTTTDIPAWLPQGKERPINPDHNWGFRVGVGVVSGCNDLRGIYTRLHSNQRVSTCPPNEKGLWVVFAHPETARFTPAFNPFFNGNPTDGIAARATATAFFDYDAADLVWGSRALLKCELALRSAFGLHFAYIDMTFADTWQGTEFEAYPTLFTDEISNRDHRKTWGIGPSAGLDVHYPLACGFGFEAHLGGAILVGDREESRDGRWIRIRIPTEGDPTVERDQVLSVHRGSRAVLFPYLNARLGLDYIWSCECCFTMQLALGYEFHSYINAVEVFRFNDSRATGQSQCDSFNLNGLYLRARVII